MCLAQTKGIAMKKVILLAAMLLSVVYVGSPAYADSQQDQDTLQQDQPQNDQNDNNEENSMENKKVDDKVRKTSSSGGGMDISSQANSFR